MHEHHLPAPLARLVRAIGWFEQALLVVVLAMMVLLAGVQIVARNFFDQSIYGSDQLLRLLVLWVAFLGAIAASREGKHIHVDAIARWLPGRIKPAVAVLTDLFTATVCGVLVWQAIRYLQSVHEAGEMVFAELPVWVAASILPLAFSLIALRYVLRMVHHIKQALGFEALQ